MFCLSTKTLTTLTAVVVENDQEEADILSHGVVLAGGTVAAQVTSIAAALAFIEAHPVDQILIPVRFLVGSPVDLTDILADKGVDVVFLTDHEDWFDGLDDEVDDCEEELMPLSSARAADFGGSRQTCH